MSISCIFGWIFVLFCIFVRYNRVKTWFESKVVVFVVTRGSHSFCFERGSALIMRMLVGVSSPGLCRSYRSSSLIHFWPDRTKQRHSKRRCGERRGTFARRME